MSTDDIRITGDLYKGDTKDDHVRVMDQGFWNYQIENKGRGLLRVRVDKQHPDGKGWSTLMSKREVAKSSTLSGRIAVHGQGQTVRFRFTRRIGTKGLDYEMNLQWDEQLVNYNETPQFMGHEGFFGSGKLSGLDTKDEVERFLRPGRWEYRIAAFGHAKLKFRVYDNLDRVAAIEIDEEDGEVTGTFELTYPSNRTRIQNKRALGSREVNYQFELNWLGEAE